MSTNSKQKENSANNTKKSKTSESKADIKISTKTEKTVANNELSETKKEKVATNIFASPKKVLFVTSEAQPFCATGGLADVCGSLPKEMRNIDKNLDIRTILPLYSNIPYCFRKDFKYIDHIYVTLSWRKEYCGVFEYKYDGITYYFIDNEKYFKRDNGAYGYMDDGERFAFFSRAVLEILPVINFFPNIIHVNDWQSALIPTYLKTSNWDERYSSIRTVLTIHNIMYQGRYGNQILTDVLGIDARFAGLMLYDNDVNILKSAIVSADRITTVSLSYAEEIKTPEHGCGLHEIVKQNAYKLSGIINGLDYDFYNPATDKVIYNNYDVNSLEVRAKNKECLQKEFNLEVNPNLPMVAFVSRINTPKGFGLLRECAERLICELNIQLVGVGSGDPEYEEFFRYLNNKFPKQVHVSLGYSLEIGKKIYSGADIYVMPSLTEPCGLSQIVASRYGVVPIVRETGGLKDTIKDFGCEGGGNGYTFASKNAGDLEYSIRRAVKDFNDKAAWKNKVKKVMSMDFSWKNTAKQYLDIYEKLY